MERRGSFTTEKSSLKQTDPTPPLSKRISFSVAEEPVMDESEASNSTASDLLMKTINEVGGDVLVNF